MKKNSQLTHKKVEENTMTNYICQKIQQPRRNGQVSRNTQPQQET